MPETPDNESRSFKKTVISVTVLSEGEWNWETLGEVAHAICEGGCSGQVVEEAVTFIGEEQMARELIKQGSDPDFLLGAKWEGWEPPTVPCRHCKRPIEKIFDTVMTIMIGL